MCALCGSPDHGMYARDAQDLRCAITKTIEAEVQELQASGFADFSELLAQCSDESKPTSVMTAITQAPVAYSASHRERMPPQLVHQVKPEGRSAPKANATRMFPEHADFQQRKSRYTREQIDARIRMWRHKRVDMPA